ncbi:unnamed protein product [Phaedon cochleariae]|uniref:Odorant receptor n=1 Tax=Phaedon cochleariae TaxID=80249 RepID=A0A9N9SI53_PHACE|nr:unnamed protein product [Phaedon cochleariae]
MRAFLCFALLALSTVNAAEDKKKDGVSAIKSKRHIGYGYGGLINGIESYSAYSAQVPHTVEDRVQTQHVQVAVPQPYPVTVDRPVAVPQAVPVDVPRPYEVPVHVRVPVDVPRPYAVNVPVPVAVKEQENVPVEVPRPYPVEVINRVPVEVLRRVVVKEPVAVRVSIPQPYPVEVPTPVQVRVRTPVYVKERQYVHTYEPQHSYSYGLANSYGYGLGNSYGLQRSYGYGLVPVPILATIQLIVARETNLAKISDTLFVILEVGICILKFLPFKNRQDDIKRTIHTVNSDNFNRATGDQSHIIEEAVKSCRRMFVIFMILCLGSLFTWPIKVLFYERRRFPIDVWLPFEPFEDIRVYLGVFLCIFIATGNAPIGNAAVDTLIPGLILHAATQIRIIKDKLEKLGRMVEKDIPEECKDISLREKDDLKNAMIYRNICDNIEHYETIYQ